MAKTVYMATTGSDSNDGLSAGAPKLTLVGSFAAMSGGDTLQIADGTYPGTPDNCIGSVSGRTGIDIHSGVDGTHIPPYGSEGAYTIIKAENEGSVIFETDNVHYLFWFSQLDGGGYIEGAWTFPMDTFHHVEFHGIEWRDALTGDGYGGGVSINVYAHHIKFFRCGVFRYNHLVGTTAEGAGFAVGLGDYYLFEECYVWGRCGRAFGAYDTGIKLTSGGALQSTTYGAKKVIFRRCVVRWDDVTAYKTSSPYAETACGFMAYCAREVEVQNCIVIDADTSKWDNVSYKAAFGMHRHDVAAYGYPQDIHWRGNIALNVKGFEAGATNVTRYLYAWDWINPYVAAPNTFEHNIAWDVEALTQFSGVDNAQACTSTWTNLTAKAADDPLFVLPRTNSTSPTTGSGGLMFYGFGASPANVDTSPLIVKNYVVIAHQEKPAVGFRSQYGCLYSNSGGWYNWQGGNGPGTYDYAENVFRLHTTNNELDPLTGLPVSPSTLGNGTPALKYICRIESGSNLSGTGEGGADRGATVMYRYGASGTLWGDPNYNTDTGEQLWPFPYETQMRASMRTYGITGDADFGKRGFCAAGETLTHYIWNYLGNGSPFDSVDTNQYGRPTADSSDGNWLNEASSNTNLYASVTKTIADDSTYITSGATPVEDAVKIKLADIFTPTTGDVTIRIRAKYD